MAYAKKSKKRTKSYSSGGSARSSSRKSGAGRKSANTKRSGRSVQTLRIVVEQPASTSAVNIVPQGQTTARKAMF